MSVVHKVHVRWDERRKLYVFDDPDRSIEGEPFMQEATEVLHELLWRDLFVRRRPFTLTFSDTSFQGAGKQGMLWAIVLQHGMGWTKEQDGKAPPPETRAGTWYFLPTYHRRPERKLWLCPVLLRYFECPPNIIHLRLEGQPDTWLSQRVEELIDEDQIARVWSGESHEDLGPDGPAPIFDDPL